MQNNIFKVNPKIAQFNQKLSKIKIRQKKNALYLRGTLPPKPGTGDLIPRQYELSTRLSATDEGVKLAYAKAQAIESDLLFERFDWSKYLGEGVSEMSCGQWVMLFEKDFWSKNEFTLNKKSYFESVYGCQFKKLDVQKPLSVDYILSMIDGQGEPNSCARYVFYRAVNSLCHFAKLPMERILAKKPRYKKTSTRDIPSDATIEAIGDAIACPENQWLYAILAIYGLRPHELFHLVELESIFVYPHYIKVSRDVKNKKPRVIFPSCVEWLDRWNVLDFGSLPLKSPNQYSNKRLGASINSKIFRNLPLTAYYLRDAYAIRCARHGVPDSICADWMGHSLSIHHEKYLCYINVSDYVDAWVKFVSPKAP